MAVVLSRGDGRETFEVIDGRPDFRNHQFGVTYAKRFPPYVFSIGYTSCLIHKIAAVEMHWWAIVGSGDRLAKVSKPFMYANTVCGMSKRLEAARTRTCIVPAPDALLCGRCHGESATFGKHGAGTKAGIRRTEAHVKLGCVVNGYPSALESARCEREDPVDRDGQGDENARKDLT